MSRGRATSASRPLTPFGFGWPNVISAFRVTFAPVIVWLIVAGGTAQRDVAAALFLVGGATDGIDGWIARRFGAISRTGQWLDPLADKLLVAAPVITLAALGAFPVWAAAILIGREAAIVLLRIVLGGRGVSMPASRAAKVKTTLQLAAIALYILPLRTGLHGLRMTVLVVAVALTVSTGLEYAVQAMRILRSERGPTR
jgi:CDP-diacylglycerol---glycerol-3-phosphate 3-phosphatidyltransferase